MHSRDPDGKVVFESPWFQVHSKPHPGSSEPLYTIHAPDFVVVVALTAAQDLLLVRQFRPAVSAVTLELPAGHVEKGETPEEAIRKELLEETGYEADAFELTATLSSSTARFTNRLWCYFAANARPRPGTKLEPGMEPVLYRKGVKALLDEKEFNTSGSCAAIFAALVRGGIRLE